jgi:hypothetical protein
VSYEHTQHGRWHVIFFAVAIVMLAGAWLARAEPAVAVLSLVIAAILVVTGLMIGSLCVRDEGEWLALRYGPLPILRKRIRYDNITAVEPGQTELIDGWGIHYILCRGWTYNLWGFGCVKLTLGTKVIRVGTDDVENLTNLLRQKIGTGQDGEKQG